MSRYCCNIVNSARCCCNSITINNVIFYCHGIYSTRYYCNNSINRTVYYCTSLPLHHDTNTTFAPSPLDIGSCTTRPSPLPRKRTKDASRYTRLPSRLQRYGRRLGKTERPTPTPILGGRRKDSPPHRTEQKLPNFSAQTRRMQ